MPQLSTGCVFVSLNVNAALFSKLSQRYCVVSVRLILLLLSVHTNTSTITDFKPLWWHWRIYLQTNQTWCP